MSSITSRQRAIRNLLTQISPMSPVAMPPSEGIGNATAEAVTAVCQVPEQASSVRDGYALRAEDIKRAGALQPVRLEIKQAIQAESRNPIPLKPGDAARVLTGGPVPEGADSVLAEEDVEVDGSVIVIRTPVRKGWFVRAAGGEIDAGAVIAPQGRIISPQAAAVMTRTRTGHIMVHPKPTARLIALGSELIDPKIHDDPNRFPADNLVLQRGLFESSGAVVTEATVVPDDKNRLISILSQATQPELIVTTGGTGRSERDFARTGALESGFSILFEEVDIRPGRHVFAAIRDNTLLFGLPGPPAAGHACFHALILPVIRRLRGLPDQIEPIMARFTQGISARPGSEWFVQCTLTMHGSQLIATPLAGKEVPPMVGLSQANGLAILQSGEAILPGDEAEIVTTLF
ncbi:molybdopterin molybdotransferase MoeA [uncultured Pseudodesulfovibrio sp.]|uniref:molybdopterin molybdotransferase MoeA n=1 Tax=uncultured Pseudodesulfovibrio sp. TaxID=2035858 RepID=UPI0029C7B256|nr:molybdopterin molybdotransferase MoeA [uncultured Pseudodesulfovibrio sp.]